MSYSKIGLVDIITGESGNDLSLTSPTFTHEDVTEYHQDDPIVGIDTIVLELLFITENEGGHARFFYFENRNVTNIESEIDFQIGDHTVLGTFNSN